MKKKKGETLYVGIDLGTSKTAISADNGFKETIPSLVGWPKDIVSRKFLKKEILIGEEVNKNRLSLDVSKPLQNGIVKDNKKDLKAARELLKHSLEMAKKKKDYKSVYAIVGAPSQTDHINKTNLLAICRDMTDSVMLVSEPFAVSYGTDNMNHSIIVDLGAGTVDLCRMHATLPEEGDEISLPGGGEQIDKMIVELVERDYKGASIPLNLARKWKEEFGFVGEPPERIKVEIPLEGKDTMIDITEQVGSACYSIMDDILGALRGLISSYDSEFQGELKKNIVLAGRLSSLNGLENAIKEGLKDMGDLNVKTVKDPVFTGAEGALMLSREMPKDYWTQVEQ